MYRGQYWLQENGTDMGPKNSCSYADIVAEEINKKVLESRSIYPELRCWFRFRNDTIVLWRGTMERLQAFFRILTHLTRIYSLLYGCGWAQFAFSRSFDFYS